MSETSKLQKGDRVYRLTFFDEEDKEIGADRKRVTRPLSNDIEREVQFMASARQVDASSYSVRMLRPQEVKKIIRAQRCEEWVEEVTYTSLGLIGLNRENLLPVLSPMLDIQRSEVKA